MGRTGERCRYETLLKFSKGKERVREGEQAGGFRID